MMWTVLQIDCCFFFKDLFLHCDFQFIDRRTDRWTERLCDQKTHFRQINELYWAYSVENEIEMDFKAAEYFMKEAIDLIEMWCVKEYKILILLLLFLDFDMEHCYYSSIHLSSFAYSGCGSWLVLEPIASLSGWTVGYTTVFLSNFPPVLWLHHFSVPLPSSGCDTCAFCSAFKPKPYCARWPFSFSIPTRVQVNFVDRGLPRGAVCTFGIFGNTL